MTALLIWISIVPAATGYDAVFSESVAAYDAGDFALAADLLEQIVDQGVVEDDVFFNLGNAYYRLGRKGEAIANYERAIQLNPSHGDALRNLDKTLSETPRGLARPLPPEWERALLFWHHGFERGTSGLAAVALWTAGWLILAVRRFKPIPHFTAAGVACLLFGVLFGASWYAKSHPLPIAVVINEKVPVRYGTDSDDKVRFELFVGDRVLVEANEGDWIRVATIGRERGWTQSENLVFVGPPYRGFGTAQVTAESGS